MNRLHCVIAVAALAVAGALFTTSGFARQPAAQALVRDLTNLVAAPQTPSVNTNDALVGLWRLTKGRFNGKEFSVREGQTVLKLAGGQGRFPPLDDDSRMAAEDLRLAESALCVACCLKCVYRSQLSVGLRHARVQRLPLVMLLV